MPLGYYPSNTTVVYNSRKTLVSSFPRRPFGLTFIGRRFSEEKLISLACAYEAATQVRARGQQYFVSNIFFVFYEEFMTDLVSCLGSDYPDW